MRGLIVLMILLSVGCIIEGGPGRSTPSEYPPATLATAGPEHNRELVTVSGVLTKGYFKNGKKVCKSRYFLDGTNLQVEGEHLDYLVGKNIKVTGTLTAPLCNVECVCEYRIDADKIEVQEKQIVTG